MKRREFMGSAVALAGSVAAGRGVLDAQTRKAAGQKVPQRRSILNFNENMEYRRLGKTGLMVSAVCLGGHWKRVARMLPIPFKGEGYSKQDYENVNNPEFLKNRHDVVSRCIELGINYVDACAGPEILAYAKVLKGRRDKFYFGFSWHERESRFEAFRTGRALMEGLDQGLREAGLDYVDVWRISLPMEMISNLGELQRIEEGAMDALDKARQQGKSRFTGVSTHNRQWLKTMIEQYPRQMQVALFPYTAATRELPDESVFDAIKQQDVGVFGIKPFADNSLFLGDSSPGNPHAEDDDRRARLALRYILGNPAITAPIPGLVSLHQVNNAAQALKERRELDLKERAELERAGRRMWANLRPGYEWLRQWEYV
jgi:aryl-alcohol dehydrogenase-like predicted oxidoreductase